jgi:hypothetical protein
MAALLSSPVVGSSTNRMEGLATSSRPIVSSLRWLGEMPGVCNVCATHRGHSDVGNDTVDTVHRHFKMKLHIQR